MRLGGAPPTFIPLLRRLRHGPPLSCASAVIPGTQRSYPTGGHNHFSRECALQRRLYSLSIGRGSGSLSEAIKKLLSTLLPGIEDHLQWEKERPSLFVEEETESGAQNDCDEFADSAEFLDKLIQVSTRDTRASIDFVRVQGWLIRAFSVAVDKI